MNEDDALVLAQRLALAGNHVRIRRVASGDDGYDVEVIEDSTQDPQAEAKTKRVVRRIDRRLGRMEGLLARAQPKASKIESLRRIQRVVDSYVEKLQRMRGHRDMEIATDGEQIFEELSGISNILDELIQQEETGQPTGDFQIDLYHRVSAIAGRLAQRLRAHRGRESLGGVSQNSPGTISKKKRQGP